MPKRDPDNGQWGLKKIRNYLEVRGWIEEELSTEEVLRWIFEDRIWMYAKEGKAL